MDIIIATILVFVFVGMNMIAYLRVQRANLDKKRDKEAFDYLVRRVAILENEIIRLKTREAKSV